MTRAPIDIPLEKIAVEHYLFDLGYSVEKTSEIFDMNEDAVRRIYDDYRSVSFPRSSK